MSQYSRATSLKSKQYRLQSPNQLHKKIGGGNNLQINVIQAQQPDQVSSAGMKDNVGANLGSPNEYPANNLSFN